MKENDYLTIPQLAEILGVSRIAIYKKVKKGQIKAIRVGRNYAIPKKYISEILGDSLSEASKKQIDKAISRTVKEYGEVLRLLGRE
jgi:excisionase family DNA binding protein